MSTGTESIQDRTKKQEAQTASMDVVPAHAVAAPRGCAR